MKPRIVIENMEDPTPWVVGEYLHSYRIAGKRILVSNAPIKMIETLKKMEPELEATPQPASEVCRRKKTLLLDPDAHTRLDPILLRRYDCVVVGGIMGDYPRKGRTKIIRETMPWADTANIGPEQFSVDGTVYVIVSMLEGKRLEDIPVVKRPEIEIRTPLGSYTLELPFAYPLVDGKPLISEDVIWYLSRIEGLEF